MSSRSTLQAHACVMQLIIQDSGLVTFREMTFSLL